MALDYQETGFSPQLIPELKQDLADTKFAPLVPVVEQHREGAIMTASFLDQLRRGIKGGELNEVVIIGEHPLGGGPLNLDTETYIRPGKSSLEQGRDATIRALRPPSNRRDLFAYFLDLQNAELYPYLKLEKGTIGVKVNPTNINGVKVMQILYYKEGFRTWCQERLAYIPDHLQSKLMAKLPPIPVVKDDVNWINVHQGTENAYVDISDVASPFFQFAER